MPSFFNKFKKFKPKYVAKVNITPTNVRYFYTNAEYQAYLNGQKVKQMLNNTKQKAVDTLTNRQNTNVSTKVNDFGKKIEAGKKAVEKYGNTHASNLYKELSPLGKLFVTASTGLVGTAIASLTKVLVQDQDTKPEPVPEPEPEPEPKIDPTKYHKESDGTYEPDDRIEYNKYIHDNYENVDSFDELSRLEDDNTKYDKDYLQMQVNPNYKIYDREINEYEDRYGYEQNCSLCTSTYDLLRRGYDVTVVNDSAGRTDEEIESWYKNGKFTYYLTYDMFLNSGIYTNEEYTNKILTKMEKNTPNGAYGQFTVSWTTGSGHSMVYEKENGKIIVRDCQTNKKYTKEEFVQEYGDYIRSASNMRTDNLEMTDEILKNVKTRKRKKD